MSTCGGTTGCAPSDNLSRVRSVDKGYIPSLFFNICADPVPMPPNRVSALDTLRVLPNEDSGTPIVTLAEEMGSGNSGGNLPILESAGWMFP